MPRISRMRFSVAMLMVCFALSACSSSGQGSEEESAPSRPDVDVARSTPESEAPAEFGYPFGRIRGAALSLDGTRPDGGVFYVDGNTVYVTFPAGRIGDIENDYCVGQYDMVAEETSNEVNVSVFRVWPAHPPAEVPCALVLGSATFDVTLEHPLGDRSLSTGVTRRESCVH